MVQTEYDGKSNVKNRYKSILYIRVHRGKYKVNYILRVTQKWPIWEHFGQIEIYTEKKYVILHLLLNTKAKKIVQNLAVLKDFE